ncbi:MAG: iron export ABC transporter permease subunit FetB [Tissierellia bacterium]|nr:iron export ABC transporter permease subunit FetB [Tissierellia bacterium]
MENAQISTQSLLIASSLIFITIFFSYWQKLDLEKDTIIGVIRAVIQLIVVGYVLKYVFDLDDILFTCAIVVFMMVNAAYNTKKRGKGIKNAFWISLLGIFVGETITILVLLLSGAIEFKAYQVIPISGMIISNSMVAISLCYRNMLVNFKDRRDEIETKLALGSDLLFASKDIIRDTMKTGMLPSIDSAKTLGIVSLPGMMTGLILAGTDPLQAIKYQLMVTFMLLSTTSIASLIVCYLAYRTFYNDRAQVVDLK